MTIRSLHVQADARQAGTRRRLRLLIQGLESLGHPAFVAAPPGPDFDRPVAEGLRFVAVEPRNEFDVHAGWQLAKVLSSVRPDLVHAHDTAAVALSAMALQMQHDVRPPPRLVASRRSDLHLQRRAFSRWTHGRVDAFIAASEPIHRLLLADGIPADRVVTVHDGVNAAAIDRVSAADVHAEFWLPHGAQVVGNAAMLVPHKGHRYLVAAARLVVRELPDTRFVIIGDGELRESLGRQVHELGLERHVTLTGYRPDALALVKSLDVFVVSSVVDSLGSAVLEAMACGRPVVGTRAGGIPDAIVDGETGLLVPPQDDAALAAAIVRLLSDPMLRRKLADAGRRRVVTAFSVERHVECTLSVYRRCLGRQ